MYTIKNFQTKKQLKEALALGREIGIFDPSPFNHTLPTNGPVYLEGSHYPQPHKWYATAYLVNGLIVKVK